MLTRGQDCEYCVLDWVELVSQAFDHGFVKNKQVFVLCGVKSLVLEVANEFVSNLMPKLFFELQGDCLDAFIEGWVLDSLVLEYCKGALRDHF